MLYAAYGTQYYMVTSKTHKSKRVWTFKNVFLMGMQ